MREIIPTVVPHEAAGVVAALSRYSFAQTLHIDFADGTLAPNTTWFPVSKDDLPKTETRYEAHLMVADPLSFGIACARAGARRLIAHVESFAHVERAGEMFALWRAAGVEEIGCALNLLTPTSVCDSYAPLVDFVQLMTIEHIGEQGQPFDARAFSRVSALRARHPELAIAVDGGITKESILGLASAGATRFCVGAALAQAEDPASTYQELLAAANAVS
jgi:ribulose-phosphate 3-epimerase